MSGTVPAEKRSSFLLCIPLVRLRFGRELDYESDLERVSIHYHDKFDNINALDDVGH